MNLNPGRDGRTYWTPPVETVTQDLETEPINPEFLRPTSRRRPGRERRELDGSSIAQVAEDDAIQRVGGRRRIRSEVLLLAAGAVFLAGALAKPWPNPAATARSTGVAPSASLAISPDDSPDIHIGISSDVAQGWSAVDWSVLRGTDPHPKWGIATTVMPSLLNGLAEPDKASPKTTWTAATSPTGDLTVPVVHGLSAYAIAVTWPHNLDVTQVTFQYLGGPDFYSDIAPPGFPPFVQVSPSPGNGVALPMAVGSFGTSKSPVAISTGKTLSSGEFWIPPSDASLNAAIASPVPPDWRLLPWPWPNGSYAVRVTASTGTTTLFLKLEQVEPGSSSP
jgi:hypothetical protein